MFSRPETAGARRFLLRFVLISVPLFAAWELWLRGPYLAFLAHVFAGTGRLAGFDLRVVLTSPHELRFALGEIVWGNRFGMTAVNVVPFAALVFATNGISRSRRARLFAAGMALLAATHLLGLWTDVAHVKWHVQAATLANGLRALVNGFGTFAFPLLIWTLLLRGRSR